MRELTQDAVDLGNFKILGIFVIGDGFQQGGEIVDKGRGDSLGHAGMPLAAGAAQHDQAGLAGQHFDGNIQDAVEQGIQVELLSERPGYLQQIIPLSNPNIRQHKHIERN